MPDPESEAALATRSPEARLEEARGLAMAIALNVVHGEVVHVSHPTPATLFGKGAMERIAELVREHEAELVFVDHAVTPVQQRNLEKAWNTKVIERTGLILEIFGERARTGEGKLQVELAALTYQRSRLVRSWTHLERQRGGFGFIGGPGETQLEADRRLIGDQITRIKAELENVIRTRELHRQARKRVPYAVVALVGYTNAGKSTLFNRLTKSEVFAKDLLFATLDPTMREVRLPTGRHIILSDTVGFISDLPTQLVAAFRATLEEVQQADVILHVRDISHPDTEAQKADVMAVLADLDIDTGEQGNLIEVSNKMDLMPPEDAQWLAKELSESLNRAAVSAITGEGLDLLLRKIESLLSKDMCVAEYSLDISNGAALAWLYEHAEVLKRKDDEEKVHLKVRISPDNIGRFEGRFLGFDQ
ncbi:MAG TPA: GTPase HflX [Rhodospirillaceae bacterium]|nr:MAG: GTPase HflX [Alphaproteobacteria bacterium GWF2_58_20]HAU28727.1 GTPase HflX [Rhodospirillaceae bacterium]